MNRTAIFLSGAFLIVVFGVGIVQAAVEVFHGERPQALDLFSSPPTEQHLRTYEKDLEKASWFAQQLRPWVQYARFRLFGDLGENSIPGRDGWLFYRPDVEYLIQPLPENNAMEAIKAFHAGLLARGIRLLVVPVPGKPSSYPEMLTGRVPADDDRVSANTFKTIQVLREAGVEVLDLFPVLRGQVPETLLAAPTYLAQDTHWSPAGMRRAAEATAKRLAELGWIAEGTMNYSLKPVSIQRQGDVLKMLQNPRIERGFAPQTVDCEQVVMPESGQPCQDDPLSEALVLGDSFLRIYERDEPGSAGFISHLAHALHRPMASIVNDGGASTLVRQELARRPQLLEGKKVVVWEFVERDLRFGTEGWQVVPLPGTAGIP